MKSQLTVVGLGGSLAEHSSSLAALKIALEGAAEAGAKTDLLDIRQLSLPMYDPGAENNPPESVRGMCDTIQRFLSVCTPTANQSGRGKSGN
jgi:FMN reductase